MIEACPERVVAVLPQMVLPLKNALNTREPKIVVVTLKIIRALIKADARVRLRARRTAADALPGGRVPRPVLPPAPANLQPAAV